MSNVAPVRKELLVKASQERCFRVFTAGLDKWWPRDHHIGSSPLKECRMEPHVGGRWYSVCEDGSEVNVGRVLLWEPPNRLVLSWQITAAWAFDPEFVTEVELRFVPEAAARTRVTLEHRKLEAYAADAEAMHKAFDADDAWVRTLNLFAESAEKNA